MPSGTCSARGPGGRLELERAYEEGWLRAAASPGVYSFHPLAREYLRERAATRHGLPGVRDLRERVAVAIAAEGREEEALELLAEAGAWSAYAARLEGVGVQWARSGQGERARAALGRIPRAERDRPGLHYLEGQLALGAGDLEGALASYGRAEAAAASQEERARAQNSQGAALSQRGRYAEALARFRAALATLGAGGESSLGGDIRNNSGVTWLRLGRYGDAQRAFRDAARAYRAAGQRDREALTLHNLGVAHQERGEFLEAQRAYEDALRLKRLTGARARIPSTLVNLGELKHHLGSGGEARELLEEARRLCREDHDPVNEAYATVNLADLDLDGGETTRALRGYRVALSLLEEGEDAHARAQAHLGLARVHRLEGRPDEALMELSLVEEDERGSAWQLENGLSRQALGERDAAEAAFAAAVSAAREREASFDLARALLARAALSGSEADAREGGELRRRYGYESLDAGLPAAPATPAAEGAAIYLLGRFGLRLGERELTLSDLPTRKAAMVLASLALASGPLGKEQLAEAYWADSRNPTGSLDTALYHLRAALGKEAVQSGRGLVSLTLEAGVDARDLLARIEAARRGRAALQDLEAVRAAYGGPLLPEFPEAFELERRAVEEGVLWALEALAGAYQGQGRAEEAAGVWHDLLRLDPYHTGAHEWLIGHYEATSQPSRAQRQRELLEAALAELT